MVFGISLEISQGISGFPKGFRDFTRISRVISKSQIKICTGFRKVINPEGFNYHSLKSVQDFAGISGFHWDSVISRVISRFNEGF